MNSLIVIATLVAAASAQFSPFSGGFGASSGLSPFAGSGLGAYSSFRPFSGFGAASSLPSLYGGSQSMYGSASTSHPYYGSSPYGAASSPSYASSPYTTSFSSQPQYSASLGSPMRGFSSPYSSPLYSSPSSLSNMYSSYGRGY